MPTSSTIISAILKLPIASAGDNWGTTGRPIELHRMTQSWTELGATWNCPNDTNTANNLPDCSPTWNMDNSSSWPFTPLVTASTTITTNMTGTVSLDVTSDIQSFISGSTTNYGWILKKSDETQPGEIEFNSRETTNSPKLIITYQI